MIYTHAGMFPNPWPTVPQTFSQSLSRCEHNVLGHRCLPLSKWPPGWPSFGPVSPAPLSWPLPQQIHRTRRSLSQQRSWSWEEHVAGWEEAFLSKAAGHLRCSRVQTAVNSQPHPGLLSREGGAGPENLHFPGDAAAGLGAPL